MALPVFAGGRSGTTSGSSGVSYPTGRVSYPISTDVTLTYWMPLSFADRYTNNGDLPFFQGLQQRTGIKIQFLHPAGNANEQFNLMVAAGDLPDLLYRAIYSYPGGPEKAIADGVVLRLNDLIDNYAPNLKAKITADRDFDRRIKTDNGSYYTFPFFRSDPQLGVWQGFIMRKDWLDDLGLQPPETYDDWYNVLTAFKNRKNSPAPLSVNLTNSGLAFGYGFAFWFFRGDDGTAQWGQNQAAYRDYLTMMNRWYREGLIDPDAATLSGAQITAKITNGTAGATFGSVGGNLGGWLPAGKALDPKFDLMGVKHPVRVRGTEVPITAINMQYNGSSAGSVSIGGTTKYPELAARFLDYGYGDEGHMYYNFGTLGQSYTMVNGFPTYTDLILNNPTGLTLSQALSVYATASSGPYFQDLRTYAQGQPYQQQRDAIVAWTTRDPYSHYLPSLTPTIEESGEQAQIMTEINTYAGEMMLRFILGTEPLSNFDNYIATLNRMGIGRALAIQNAALARYSSR